MKRAVATFCHNTANDLPITVNDRSTELELLYIDDLVREMLDALENNEHHCAFDGIHTVMTETGKYCAVPTTHRVTLGEIADLLAQFRQQPETLLMPEIPANSFAKKLYSAYLSYLPPEKVRFPLKMNTDDRGSFTEIMAFIASRIASPLKPVNGFSSSPFFDFFFTLFFSLASL